MTFDTVTLAKLTADFDSSNVTSEMSSYISRKLQMYISDNNARFLNKNFYIKIIISPFFEQKYRYFHYIMINVIIKLIKNSIGYFIDFMILIPIRKSYVGFPPYWQNINLILHDVCHVFT